MRIRFTAWLILMLVVLVGAPYVRHALPGGERDILKPIEGLAVLVIGWQLSGALAAFTPVLFRRLDIATIGSLRLILRVGSLTAVVFASLSVAGVRWGTLALGGALTAVVLGLAAQQTLGNLIAGLVLLGTRPFKVGDHVRFQAGALGGPIEGTVVALGIAYTTISRGNDRIIVPNSVTLGASVSPFHDSETMSIRARVPSHFLPSQIQFRLSQAIEVPLEGFVSVTPEEFDEHGLVVRITATPVTATDRVPLADQILDVITTLSDV